MLIAEDKTREQIISENMGLVYASAHRFKGRGIEYDDLVQAGCIGLIKAADAFDNERGVRFSTYAVPVILGEMRRLFRDGGTVKVSRTLKEMSLKAMRERERFSLKNGREPSVYELADILELPPEDVAQAINAAAPPLSLTESDDDGGGQIDLPVASPEDLLSDKIALKQVVGLLEPRDRQLIALRYFMGKTQTQTAEELGMTQVQVSRREKKLLLAMRCQLLE
ncbi:MAG TPA: flagellar biosynthesis protein FliA [Ruminococcaceae bacterium]|nr:flagellar biosynthesis protein FliA [Oscillospiraceae bacterium]